jgi:predicted outer membrane repeat protein
MSARSMIRGHERELRRNRTRARRAGAGAALALGAGVLLAPTAGAAVTRPVNQLGDDGDGTCDASCTLRDAVDDANAEAAPDTITFASDLGDGIVLYPPRGPIQINSAMTIDGPGARALAVSGGDATQIFKVNTDTVGAANDRVTISGLVLRDGQVANNGAAISSLNSDLRIDGAVLTGNNADLTGGAVYSYGGSLTVTDSIFVDNEGSKGGAIYADSDSGESSLTVRNSSFGGNTSSASNGGAIYADDNLDSMLIAGSTFVGNEAAGNGGAILIFGPRADATIQNSTITGNHATQAGGGVAIYNNEDIPTKIKNSTISDNTADVIGGGIYRNAYDNPPGGPDTTTISSSIVAGNTAPAAPDVADRVYLLGDGPVNGSFLIGHSLIGDTSGGATITATPGGSNELNVDAQLGPLAENGGPTETMLPGESSPAIDAGIAGGLTVDQRGLDRTSDGDPVNFAGSDGTDIGAVERDIALEGAKVKAKGTQKHKGKKIVVKVKVGAAEDATAAAKGKIGKAKLKTATTEVDAGETMTLKLKPKGKKTSKKLANELDKGKKLRAKLKVTITDAAGNSETARPKVKLK